MSDAAHRRNTLLVSTNSAPAWGASYTVTAYEPGAQVASDSTGTTVTVRAGHGFEAGDKFIVGTDTSKFVTVSVAGATSLTVTPAVTVSTNDYLTNLGADTGSTGPNYDASGRAIYQDMGLAGTAITQSRVTADAQGVYSYWYDDGLEIWELVRNTNGTPVAVLPGIREMGDDPVVYGDFVQQTANGGLWTRAHASENLTLSTSGTTTDTSANLLPANAIIEAVVARVTTTITTATDWKLGDSAQAARFTAAQSGAQLTAGATVVGLLHRDPTVASSNLGPVQSSAAAVRVTTTGTPGAGRIRVTVFYSAFTAPTS